MADAFEPTRPEPAIRRATAAQSVSMARSFRSMAMLAALTLLPNSCACLRPGRGPKCAPGISRRAAGCTFFLAALSPSNPSFAFDNGVPEMARFKNEKKSGVDIPLYTPNNKKPLGLQDNSKLATCDDGPNCFSTSGDSRHLLEVWSPQAGDAMGELLAAVKAYPPGQNGACSSPGGASTCVDGGGFQIVSSTPSYLYVQFESLKYGFIDDVEFAVDAKGAVQVRSASRVGKLDYFVNAKRLNLISGQLRAKGWTAPAISQTTHPEYFRQGQR